MIVDRDVDMVTACVTRVNAVLRNRYPMLAWIGLLVFLTALGFGTLGLELMWRDTVSSGFHYMKS